MPNDSNRKRDLARYFSFQSSLAKLKKNIEISEEFLANNPGIVRIGRRDPATGKYQVYYPDGGDFLGGQKTFNASIAHGSPVRATSAHNSPVVAIDSKSAVKSKLPVEPDVVKVDVYKVKTLFYLYSVDIYTGEQNIDFYIGGDRSSPIKINTVLSSELLQPPAS